MLVNACTARRIVFPAMGLMALPALAGTPAALDRVPSDAQMVIVAPHLGELLNDLNAINALLGENSDPMLMMGTSMIRGWPGIDLGGSFVAVLDFDDEMADEPESVFLVPVSDFAAFSDGHESDEGIFEMDIDGETVFFRDAGGGFAVLGEDEDLVSEYDASAGNLESHSALLGKAGGRIAEGNDLFLYVNFDGFAEVIEEAIEELESEVEMVEMAGGADAAAGFDAFVDIARTVAVDSASFAVGINFDQDSGVSFDAGLQFKEGSISGSYFQNQGNAGQYLAKAPAMDYFFASAFDLSGEGVSKLVRGYLEISQQFDTTGMLGGMELEAFAGGMNGGIQVMGASDNIMGGLFANTMYYTDFDDPQACIAKAQEVYASMGASMSGLEQAGIQVSAAMDTEPTEINGTQAYGYSFGMDMSGLSEMTQGMGGPNPAMIMGMIFGPEGGPNGYIAEAGGGVVMTLSKDADFFSKVVAGANGENTMAEDSSIAATAAMLPSNRIMETYIAADHLVNTAGPMLMMFGVIPDFEPVDALAPIGFGLTADGGGMLLRAVFPIHTIGSIGEMIPSGQDEGDSDSESGSMDF